MKPLAALPLPGVRLLILLRNRFYIGEVAFKGEVLAGEQPAIIDRDLFDAVQARLSEQVTNHKVSRTGSEALLLGRIVDDRGHRMSPSHVRKRAIKYRYYLSSALPQGRPKQAGTVTGFRHERSKPSSPMPFEITRQPTEVEDTVLINTHVVRVEVRPDQFVIGSHHIRTSLHPRSICIGETGFLGPETNRPKSPSGQKRSPRRPKRSRKSAPIAGSLAVSGKSRGSKECVLGLRGLEPSPRTLRQTARQVMMRRLLSQFRHLRTASIARAKTRPAKRDCAMM